MKDYKELAYRLCDALLELPCGCDACFLKTDKVDEEGNAICDLNSVDSEDCKIDVYCFNTGIYVEGFNNGYKEKEKEFKKYRWHDLRKNPDDLPRRGERILFYTIKFEEDSYYEPRYLTGHYYQVDGFGEFENDDYEQYVTRGMYTGDEVIAWKYIEPFEEEE